MTSTDAHAIDHPGLAWLAARLRWERTLESLRLHRAVTGAHCLEHERSAA